MMRFARISLSLATLVVALVTSVTTMAVTPAASAATTASRVETTSVAPSYDVLVLRWTNAYRRHYGLRPLRAAVCMDRFTTSWTRYMAARDSFRHQSMYPIMRRCGQHTAGENIARATGTLGAERVVSMWMHSPGHRANILNGRYRYLSVDAFRSRDSGYVYVTQDFAG
jgi:uncharacterized protein YkwD